MQQDDLPDAFKHIADELGRAQAENKANSYILLEIKNRPRPNRGRSQSDKFRISFKSMSFFARAGGANPKGGPDLNCCMPAFHATGPLTSAALDKAH